MEVASIERERIAGLAKLRAFSAGWSILTAMIREWFKRNDKESAQEIWSPSNTSVTLHVNQMENQNGKGH